VNNDVTGVFAAASTPFNADLTIDHGRLGAHCRRLLDEGCHGIALLGTTGEANSLSVGERKAVVESVLKSGVRPDQLAPGVGVAAVPETIELTRHALSQGVTKVVMLPPFYYKGVSDDGLFAAYSRIIEGIGNNRLRIILYHIPPMSAVPLSRDLVKRLLAAFPGIVVGIKDSSGDLANMEAMARENPQLSVLAGADPLMLPLLKSGGAGCITACANLVARNLRFVFDNWRDAGKAADVESNQARIVAWRTYANAFGPQLPTVKSLLELTTGEPGWRRVRPPLIENAGAQLKEMRDKLPA
jgi:4-hydroxy-tetrahydrodipicolinate synthase